MSTQQTPKEFAAQWWAERFMHDNLREQFKAELLARIPDKGNTLLDVDYDPKGILLDAVNAVGLKCSGYMFSAQGILPSKHLMWVRPEEGLCEWRCGYGGRWEHRRFPADAAGAKAREGVAERSAEGQRQAKTDPDEGGGTPQDHQTPDIQVR